MARTYFRPGQEIEARYLTHFQETLMEALRHLRLALGSGYIFYGFDVQEEAANGLLHISPGLAFDGKGRAVALDSALPLPPPSEAGPRWLCLRHHLLVDERDLADRPLRERDSVEVVWLPAPPRDDDTIPLARLQQGPAGWLIDASVARRAPTLAHRHTGQTLPDLSGRLRYDGIPVRLTTPAGEEQRLALQRLEAAIAAEFAKLNARLDQVGEQQRMQALEVEEMRAEIAETAERAFLTPDDSEERLSEEGGWQRALSDLREELSLTVGDDLREELELLRAELTALAQRPGSASSHGGAFTPVAALHGVGDSYAKKLHEAGIQTVSDLLVAAATRESRERVEATGIAASRLKRWSREADLLRLYGAGPDEVALLDSIGLFSTATLATEEPRSLYDRLRAAAQKRGDLAAPAYAWVESWIEQAKRLPPVVEW